MHIGIDATCWQNRRGYGRHLRALLGALVGLDHDNQYTLFMDSAELGAPVPETLDVRQVRSGTPATMAAAAGDHRSLRDMWHMSRAMSAAGFDLLLFPTVYSYVPVLSRAKKVVMIHDLIAETYPQLTLPGTVSRLFWNAKVSLGRWQADAIVTVSEYSRQAIAEHFKTDPGRIFVVGEASDPIFRRLEAPCATPGLKSLGLDGSGRYIVYVGGFGPHKNLEALVSQFAEIASREGFADVTLVMVGEYQKEVFFSHITTVQEQIVALDLEDRVVFTGFIPDDELVVLLNLAEVLVLPSLMEGFGLPAVEAAACGCPVVATAASPLPQLLGDGGLYFDPEKPNELGTALARVLESAPLRGQMREAGVAAACALTWEKAARQMMTVMDEVAAS